LLFALLIDGDAAGLVGQGSKKTKTGDAPFYDAIPILRALHLRQPEPAFSRRGFAPDSALGKRDRRCQLAKANELHERMIGGAMDWTADRMILCRAICALIFRLCLAHAVSEIDQRGPQSSKAAAAGVIALGSHVLIECRDNGGGLVGKLGDAADSLADVWCHESAAIWAL
jgi:hypothetical protein